MVELRSRHSVLGAVIGGCFPISPLRAVTTTRRLRSTGFALFPGMSSLQTPGRNLKRVAAAQHVGGRVVGPKPGACSDGQKPTARQYFWFPALYSADSSAIAQRPGPICGVAGVASSQVLEARGRLSPVATLVWEPESGSHSVSWLPS